MTIILVFAREFANLIVITTINDISVMTASVLNVTATKKETVKINFFFLEGLRGGQKKSRKNILIFMLRTSFMYLCLSHGKSTRPGMAKGLGLFFFYCHYPMNILGIMRIDFDTLCFCYLLDSIFPGSQISKYLDFQIQIFTATASTSSQNQTQIST